MLLNTDGLQIIKSEFIDCGSFGTSDYGISATSFGKPACCRDWNSWFVKGNCYTQPIGDIANFEH